MKAKSRHARFYLALEIGTVILALFLYLTVYRPKDRVDTEWKRAINRGQVALDRGDFTEARREFQSSLEFAEKHKMGELDVAASQDRLADAERGLKDYEDAIRLDERAQPVFQRSQSRWEGLYAGFLVKLAASYQQVGRYEQAETLYKQALSLQEKSFGPNALPLVDTLTSMAYFYDDWDRNEIAERLAKRSLAICQSRLGPKDPRTAWAASMLSFVYDGAGRFAEAERLAHESLPILETSLGSQSDEVASTFNRLGLALDGEGRWAEAEVAFLKTLAIRQERSGAQSDDLVVILRNLAKVYSEEGKQQDAIAFRKRAEDISGKHYCEGQEFLYEISSVASAVGHTEEWHMYRNDEGDFSVLLPTEPKKCVVEGENDTETAIQAISGSVAYTVVYANINNEHALDERAFKVYLDNVLKGSTGGLANCDLVTKNLPSLALPGYLGAWYRMKCRIRSKEESVVGNLYLGNHHAYSIFVVFPTGTTKPSTVKRFLSSFSLIDAGK